MTTTTTKYLPIVTLFQQAATKLRFPRIRTSFANNKPLCLKLSGERAKIPGCVTVTSGHPYGDPEGTYYGRILPNGELELHYRLHQLEAELITSWLNDFAANPAKVALAYGQRTCSCMFCARELTTNESRYNGYGPICAEKWSLPWGSEYQTAKNSEQLAEL